MLGCTKDIDVQYEVEKKLSIFAQTFETKLKYLDDIFQKLDQRQGRIERESKTQKLETKKMIGESTVIIKDQLAAVFQTLGEDFKSKLETREKFYETELKSLVQKIESLELMMLKESERVDKMQNMSFVIDDEASNKELLREEDKKTDDLCDQVDELFSFETDSENSKRNNLIFYGIPHEDRESSKSLILKIKNILSNKLKINRFIAISKASRILGKSSASQILFILGRITPFIRKSSGYWNFNDQDLKIIRMSNVPFFYG